MPKIKTIIAVLTILSILLLSSCNIAQISEKPLQDEEMVYTGEAPFSKSPVPSVSSSNSVSSEEGKIVKAFIEAQNKKDWDTFTGMWISPAQAFYKDFFAFEDNIKNHNGYYTVKDVSLIDLAEIKDLRETVETNGFPDLPVSVEDSFDYSLLEQNEQVCMVIAKTNYSLYKNSWDFMDGTNYRVIILLKENGSWKVAQDSQGYPEASKFFGEELPRENTSSNASDIETENDNALTDEKVYFTKQLTGYYMGVNIGDYIHVWIKTIEGEDLWFWLDEKCKTDPETLKRFDKVKITWQNKDGSIDESGEIMNLDLITNIQNIK